jgi:hypothetical protein
MNDTIYFWMFPFGILSFLYFVYWITPPLLRWFLWTFVPPVNRKVPYVKPADSRQPFAMSSDCELFLQGLTLEQIAEYNKFLGSQMQNCAPSYRPEDLQNAAQANIPGIQAAGAQAMAVCLAACCLF